MTRKHSTRRDETRAETIKRHNAVNEPQAVPKPNGATHHAPEYFTGNTADAGTEAEATQGTSKNEPERTYTAAEVKDIVLYGYKLGFYLGQRQGHITGHRCQAEHDLPVIKNQMFRLERAGRKVDKMKAALLLANEAITATTRALVA